MARLARSTIIGYPHHVLQRGNYEQTVFEEEADFRLYHAWLRECVTRYSVEIWAYCLMKNHVHFICVPRAEGALAQAFNNLHMRYAQYFNGKRGLTGHLWKGRFLSCMLDNRSVFEEVRYIENNPIRARLVERAEDYRWSSACHHVSGKPDPIISDGIFLASEIEDWRAYLNDPGEETIVKQVRERLKTGRPAGDEEFVRKLEAIVGRRLSALPRGRPRKTAGP